MDATIVKYFRFAWIWFYLGGNKSGGTYKTVVQKADALRMATNKQLLCHGTRGCHSYLGQDALLRDVPLIIATKQNTS